MIYLQLFLAFLKVGLFSFGGAYGAIPIIRDVVMSYGWMSDGMLSYMIGVAESTPGPIMVNVATYVGSSQAGVLGAAIATVATVLPAFVIILLAVSLLKRFMKNRHLNAVLEGIKPCVIGIIAATGAYMVFENVVAVEGTALLPDVKAMVIALILAVILFGAKIVLKRKVSSIILIIVAAVLGVVIYGI